MDLEKHRYNDGMVKIYRDRERKTDFGARKNVHTLGDMDFVVKLAFAEQSLRQQDLEFAEQRGFSLTYKIKTRLRREIDNKHKCVIGGYLYDIHFIDKTRTEMYLYLEGVGDIAANDQ